MGQVWGQVRIQASLLPENETQPGDYIANPSQIFSLENAVRE